jgi:subtilisin family serine protease
MRAFEKCVDALRKPFDPRVRVAILDTGVDATHTDIAKEIQDGRIIFHDFINDSANIKDDDGHGTHCTSILAKLAPNAEIYVGRVFQISQAVEDSAAVVTKVIQICQHITMQLGINI